MQVTINLPEEATQHLQEKWGDIPRHMLETAAVEGYKSGELSSYQVRLMLGHETPVELDDLLARAGVYREYTAEELERDYETSRRASAKHLGEAGS